jgi:hypothetical protein
MMAGSSALLRPCGDRQDLLVTFQMARMLDGDSCPEKNMEMRDVS